MVKGFYNTCFTALTVGLLWGAMPAFADTPMVHTDTNLTDAIKTQVTSIETKVKKQLEFLNEQEEGKSKGKAGKSVGGSDSISGVIGNWGEELLPSFGFTESSGVNTEDSGGILNALTFQKANPTMEEIQEARQTYRKMANDLATSVIATSAASIQSATDYEKTVDARADGAVPKTTLEIAQESETEREDIKNWNGTAATWLAMTTASLLMAVDRIALEAGSSLQDSVSSTAGFLPKEITDNLGNIGNITNVIPGLGG